MPRRLRLWLDPFVALQTLRALVTGRARRTGSALTSWLGRAARRRGPRAERTLGADKAALELRPLDLRSSPSESIGATALPLAATAAAAAAAVYFAASAQAQEAAAAPAERVAGGAYDAAPSPVAALALDGDAFVGGGRVADQLDSGGVPTGGADPTAPLKPTEGPDGEGSTLSPTYAPEDKLPYGGGSNLFPGSSVDHEGRGTGASPPDTSSATTPTAGTTPAVGATSGVLPASAAGGAAPVLPRVERPARPDRPPRPARRRSSTRPRRGRAPPRARRSPRFSWPIRHSSRWRSSGTPASGPTGPTSRPTGPLSGWRSVRAENPFS